MSEISIIVPVYKTEKYLHRCIDSILTQTFTDFELILVDDGSPDRSGVICDEYAAKDARVRVIHKSNGGVSSARNAALKIAEGQYLMFCDSDDYADPQWCSKMYDVIQQHPDAWVNCNVWRVDTQGRKQVMYAETIDAPYQHVTFYSLYTAALCGSLWSTILSRDVVERNYLRFNEGYTMGEDTDFMMRYHSHCTGNLLVPQPLYNYYQNEGSTVHSYRSDNFERYKHCFTDRIQHVEQEYLGDYLDNWLWRFVKMLDEVHDPRNSMPFAKRMAYCQSMMNTDEFRYCVSNAPGKNESPLYMKVVRTRNYYLFWLFQKVCRLKAALKNRK